MAEFAECVKVNGSGSFDCRIGDIRTVRFDKRFDAVIALFHVMSYQTSDGDFFSTIETAYDHLERGGIFIFDVWHRPAVEFQQPRPREKIVIDGRGTITRCSVPSKIGGIVTVNYEFSVNDNGDYFCFTERHRLRAYDPEYIMEHTSRYFKCLISEEMLTGAAPSVNTWSVTYVLERL